MRRGPGDVSRRNEIDTLVSVGTDAPPGHHVVLISGTGVGTAGDGPLSRHG